MTEAIHKTAELARKGIALLPEHISTVRAAFPIEIDCFEHISATPDSSVVALGRLSDRRRVIAWACPDEVWKQAPQFPTSAMQHGYQILPEVPDFIHKMREPGGLQRLREALTIGGERLRRAGLALKGDL